MKKKKGKHLIEKHLISIHSAMLNLSSKQVFCKSTIVRKANILWIQLSSSKSQKAKNKSRKTNNMDHEQINLWISFRIETAFSCDEKISCAINKLLQKVCFILFHIYSLIYLQICEVGYFTVRCLVFNLLKSVSEQINLTSLQLGIA